MKLNCVKVGPYRSNSYTVYSEETRKAVVIDIGGEPSEVIDFLVENNLEVEYILITHSHFDHILGVDRLREFTKAKVVAHRNAVELMKDPAKNLSIMPICEDVSTHADILVDDGAELDAGDIHMKIMHMPGHTPCSMFIAIDDMLFTGDTLFKGTIGRCDLYGGSMKTMYKTLSRICKIKFDYKVYPGHEEFSTLSYEKEHNRYLRVGK